MPGVEIDELMQNKGSDEVPEEPTKLRKVKLSSVKTEKRQIWCWPIYTICTDKFCRTKRILIPMNRNLGSLELVELSTRM